MATRNGKDLLTREDWIRAALDALAVGGVAAVAVDRIAKVVGTTRGSFYWHFSDRRDLIDAALAQWERDNTLDRIARLETVADPAKRLRVLFREVFEQPVDAIEIALAAAGAEPLVAPVVARVTRRRREVLRRIFSELGCDEAEAEHRAWLAYGFYIGHHQLNRNPETRRERPDDLHRIVDLLSVPSPGIATNSPEAA
jgi:AcrR family transcriptional regulator